MQEISKEFILDIANIEKEAFGKDAWSENSILRELDNPNCVFRLLVEDDTLIGYYSYYISVDEAYINNIAVANKFRGKGYSKIIMNDLIETAKYHRIKNITLEVRKSNILAQNLYKSFGFAFEGYRPKFYNNTEDAAIYWYKVEG